MVRSGMFSRSAVAAVVMASALLAGAWSGPTLAAATSAPQAAGHAEPAPAAPQPHAGQPPPAADQPAESAHQPAHGAEAARAHGGEHEAGSPWTLVARLFNFALLAGALVYLLRSPLGAFLDSRREEIRGGLEKAAETRAAAAQQIQHVEARLKALPAELDTLRRNGGTEIAAEEARIREAAERERVRLLEQARREIDRRVQLTERDLTKRAGELAVDLATARVKNVITDADQQRLIDRYLDQVKPGASGSGFAPASGGEGTRR